MPFEIVRDDITKMKVDAIVNAANNTLLGGGGVDGAIHRAAGSGLLRECMSLGGCETGQAKITKGYHLPAKYVIHTVGPIWQGGGAHEEEKLASCYLSSLKLATENHCETVAFPLISSGAYGYPKDRAMDVAEKTILEYLQDHEMGVYLVIYGHEKFFEGKPLSQTVEEYIREHYVEFAAQKTVSSRRRRYENIAYHGIEETQNLAVTENLSEVDWDKVLEKTEKGFSQSLLDLIEEKGMKDSECYKGANIDKRLFSKIKSNPNYQPSKPTAYAFAVSLKLDLAETRRLLETAGYTISHSNEFDLVLEVCIRNGIYDVMQINEVLYDRNLSLLGSAVGA